MSHCKSIVFAFSAFSLLAIVSAPGVASAQPESLTINPSTGVAPAPPEAPSAAPAMQGTAPDGAGGGEAVGNAFYGEYLDHADREDSRGHHSGTVPTSHTVTTGDTLWDLSAYYFRNAWNWPKVWKLNPEIADPHWIYPGNIIRLREGGKDLTPVAMSRKQATPIVGASRGYGLRRPQRP
jgi:nucleoid-associated protein YgaU